jgi:ribosomal protein L11 methyltransferase
MKRTWYAIDVSVTSDQAEAVEDAFNRLDSLGTEIDLLTAPGSDAIVVTGYFKDRPDAAEFRRVLGEAMEDIPDARLRLVEETDWLAEWKKHWKPVETDRFVIAAPWAVVPPCEKIVIRIEPSMAFGTGTHETTQLCLNAVERLASPGKSFTDVGTGTGILAIAAAKLGASPVHACDTDEDAVVLARENAAANDVPEVEITTGPLAPDAPAADIVCANLTLDVIMPMLVLLVEKTRRKLILSGILVEQLPAIQRALDEQRLSNPDIWIRGEWAAVVVDTSH